MQAIFTQIQQVAGSNFTVLIEGETGTGKELVARAIYQQSLRCKSPFIALDCGAIPETLIESELFGYEKGAFTGADRRKAGHMELAAGGTLFLDEITNLPLTTQVSSCGRWSGRFSSWVRCARYRLTCASSRLVMCAWRMRCRPAASDRISSTASMSS